MKPAWPGTFERGYLVRRKRFSSVGTTGHGHAILETLRRKGEL